MKKQLLYSIAMTALLLTACSSDDMTQQATQQPVPIRLTACIDGSATTRGYSSTNLRNNTKVYVWADMINLSDSRRTTYFRGWELKATATAGELKSDEVKFFPATNVLDLFAMSGSFSGYSINSHNELPATDGLYHTVSTAQTSEGAYYSSDLLYAQVRNQEPVSQETGVELKFYHMLSKVRVVLIPGTGNTTDNKYDKDVLRTATVQLLNVLTRSRFTPRRDITDEDFAEQATRAAMLAEAPRTADDAEGYNPQTDITIGTGVADSKAAVDDASYADAIIVPQTVAAGQFIKVTLTDPGTGLEHSTYYRFANDFTFESGKQYEFCLTLDRIGESYEITPTISNWTAESENRPIDLIKGEE